MDKTSDTKENQQQWSVERDQENRPDPYHLDNHANRTYAQIVSNYDPDYDQNNQDGRD